MSRVYLNFDLVETLATQTLKWGTDRDIVLKLKDANSEKLEEKCC